MNKQEIYRLLEREHIAVEITEHAAAYNMAELAAIDLPYPSADAKNLFVRDDKKRNFYLITVKGDKRVELNKFRQENGLRRLSFASEEELWEHLRLTPGSVTPLGLLNDENHTVKLFLDDYFLTPPARIGVHPNDNTATVWLQTDDLLRLLRENGGDVEVVPV